MGRAAGGLVVEARLGGKEHRLEVGAAETRYSGGQISARFRTGTWELLGWTAQGTLAEGTSVDFAPCATLLVLLNAETIIPDLVGTAL